MTMNEKPSLGSLTLPHPAPEALRYGWRNRNRLRQQLAAPLAPRPLTRRLSRSCFRDPSRTTLRIGGAK